MNIIESSIILEVNCTKYTLPITTDNTTALEAAEAAAEIIMEYESVIIERLVKRKYSFLEPCEAERVCALTKDIAKNGVCRNVPGFAERKKAVLEEVRAYIDEVGYVIPAGFVDFRMRQLYSFAEKMIDKGADLFFEEKEYEEFVYLLKLFVEEKESHEEVLHLVWEEGGIRLLNKRHRDVTDKYEREFYAAAAERGIGKEDLAISAVISAAPRRIVFHSPPQSSPLKETLSKIFEGRCSECSGCNICKLC